jgi:hypothetical protein
MRLHSGETGAAAWFQRKYKSLLTESAYAPMGMEEGHL